MDVRRPKGRRIPGCAGIRRTLRALGRLARARRRIEHVPTRMQLRAMAHFDGRESSSYLLNPTVNYVTDLPPSAVSLLWPRPAWMPRDLPARRRTRPASDRR